MKRENYISWDAFFMGVAELASKRSKDPRTQVGASIVNSKKQIISTGYNGLVNGMSDDDFDWYNREEKHDYVIHAEENAILNANGNLDNCILYLYTERGYYPCSECAKKICQSGIKEVVLNFVGDRLDMKEKYNGDATKRMFKAAGVSIRVLKENQ